MSNEIVEKDNILMERIRQVAPDKLLGGMTVSSSDEDGRYKRTYNILCCNACGNSLDHEKEFSVCKKDSCVICKACSIKWNQVNVSLTCFKEDHPLDKSQFMILKSVEKNITSDSVIKKLTRVPSAEMKEAKKFLKQNKYVSKNFLCPYQITASGTEMLNVYEFQIYKDEKDISNFMERLSIL